MIDPYLSRASLAAALQISESTVDALVRRGIIPKPKRLSPGVVRWRWETVDQALASLGTEANGAVVGDEQSGVTRAIEASKERGRGRAA